MNRQMKRYTINIKYRSEHEHLNTFLLNKFNDKSCSILYDSVEELSTIKEVSLYISLIDSSVLFYTIYDNVNSECIKREIVKLITK